MLLGNTVEQARGGEYAEEARASEAGYYSAVNSLLKEILTRESEAIQDF
jgi:hypothetical protein